MSSNQRWWDAYGPFDPDPEDENFPNAGQVVRHYRLQRKWTPAQLGEALDKTARWVQAMEHDNTVPESISRRRALANILSIPPILLGLASVDQIITPATAKAASTPVRNSIDVATTTSQYQQSLRLYWELYYSSSAYDMIEEIINSTRYLRALTNETTGYRQNQIIELLCQYHQLVGHVLREQKDYQAAFSHANRAVKIAKSTENTELIASALLRRGFISFDQDQITNALTDLDAALPFANHARAPLKGFILQVAGHCHAHVKGSNADRIQALNLLDKAGNIARQSRLEDDQSFVRFNLGWYQQERAEALIVLGRSSDALDELARAEKNLGPNQPRRIAYINILQAEAYLADGEPVVAAGCAEDAFNVSQSVSSEFNISRIQELYEKLKNSKHGDSPQIARLGHLLQAH
jgi:transcriptional regulator with XRE-family HTH domain